jgi:hypothetical protein
MLLKQLKGYTLTIAEPDPSPECLENAALSTHSILNMCKEQEVSLFEVYRK